MLQQPAQKVEFAKRDVSSVEKAFSRLPTHWQNGSWLGKNKYARSTISQLTNDLTSGKSVTHRHLAEYIAASSVAHCMDGWSYFGRALNAILSGDHNCARHLGYYAELRAAMSFLAAEGIGVFDKEHIVVSAQGRCLRMPPPRSKPAKPAGPGTHQFVWEALSEWANSPSSAATLNNLIFAGGQPLSEWLRHFGFMPTIYSQLAKDWLLTWGLDIYRFADDRNARNLASYRPTAFSGTQSPSVHDTVQAIRKAWQVCEPESGNPFAALDRMLVRSAIKTAFRVGIQKSPEKAKSQFRMRVKSILEGVGPSGSAFFDWEQFLTDSAKADPFEPLLLAGGRANPTRSNHCLQVTSRALLLLRVATGAARRLVDTLPDGSRAKLDFWVESIGIEGGLWAPNLKPSSTDDLWDEIERSINELVAAAASIDSFNTLNNSFPFQVSALSSSKRIGLWGIRL